MKINNRVKYQSQDLIQPLHEYLFLEFLITGFRAIAFVNSNFTDGKLESL